MADAKYSGFVNFDDWNLEVSNMVEAGELLQETFLTGEPAVFTPSKDGLSVEVEIQSLGAGDPPTFTASLDDIGKWAVMRHEEPHPGDHVSAAPFIAELRRIADMIEAAIKKTPSPT